MESKVTILGGAIGWVAGVVTGNALWAIVLAFFTGASAHIGQLFIKYLIQKYKQWQK